MKFTGHLYPHQDEAVRRAQASPEKGFLLACEMGTGKTRAAIKLIISRGLVRPSLVVCPKSVIPSWISEIAKTSDLRAVAVSGMRLDRIKALASNADVFVINFEGLAVVEDEILLRNWDVVVLDESHKVASRSTKQSKLSAKIAARSDFVLLMSGTPVRTDARDLWHQIYLIDGGKRLGSNFYGFQNSHFVNISRNRIPLWKPRKGSEELVRARYADVAYSVKKVDVLAHLPPKIFHRRVVNMTPRQMTAYWDMANEMLVELEGEERINPAVCTAPTILTRYIRLHQIAQGFLYDDEKDVLEEFEPNPKTTELLSILADHDGKAIVWAKFRHTIESLGLLLADKGYDPVALYGGTRNAGKVIERFQEDPACRVLIGQPQAAGLGVTLTAADLAIYYTNDWSYPDRVQSEDRCHRVGSEQHTSINYVDIIAMGTIDEVILKAIEKKADTAALLTDLRGHVGRFSK